MHRGKEKTILLCLWVPGERPWPPAGVEDLVNRQTNKGLSRLLTLIKQDFTNGFI